MGLYESDHPDVRKMKGLHLFHFVLSNWPRFQDWARRASERPAFERAVVSWRP